MLTKSDLQSLVQCRRKLWLEHYKPELLPKEGSGLDRRSMDGVIVGEKAREQLGDKFIWPSNKDLSESAAKLARDQLLKFPGVPSAEVPMVRGTLYARADALIPQVKGYVLRETKASTFPLKADGITPGTPKEHHLTDVAIQAWVMEGWGLPIAGVELNLLNNNWRYPGNGDYSGLFRQLDVTNSIAERKARVPIWFSQAKRSWRVRCQKLQQASIVRNPTIALFSSIANA